MKKLLMQFWKWLGKTPEEYASTGMEGCVYQDEDEFSEFSALINGAMKIVDREFVDDDNIDNLLTVMALDNESECVLDYIEENASLKQIKKIFARGVCHPQPNARWQVAELIYRKSPRFHKYLLQRLTNDPHPYVRKRADNCLAYLQNAN